MLGNQSVRNEKPQDKVATKSQGTMRINGNGNSSTFAEQKAREELSGSKSRHEKGLELYKQGKVSIVGDGLFKVSGYYQVDTGKMTCTCPDYKSRKVTCKHLWASLLFTKNRGKQTIENLEGFNDNVPPGEQVTHVLQDNVPHAAQSKVQHAGQDKVQTPEPSDKPTEAPSKPFDRQSTITRLAVLNTATEILKTHRKPIEFNDILSLAAQLEQWALGNM